MYVYDLFHLLCIREFNVVEDTSAQECIRQFLFGIGCDDHDRSVLRLDRFFGFVDIKFHLVQFPQQVIREFQVCLVDLIDQQNHLLVRSKRLSQLAQLDILLDIRNISLSKLAVVQSLHSIVHIKSFLCLRRGFDAPDDQIHIQCLGNRFSQHGLASARLALDQKRLLQRDGYVYCIHQFFCNDVIVAPFKNIHVHIFYSSPSNKVYNFSAKKTRATDHNAMRKVKRHMSIISHILPFFKHFRGIRFPKPLQHQEKDGRFCFFVFFL